VSFGGVIAVRYAATRPERVSRLVLVSSPGPGWRLDPQTAAHVRRPLLRFPLFAARAVRRLAPETTAALPTWTNRGAFALQHSFRTLRSPTRPTLMAAWVREWQATDITADARRVVALTLVITGEPDLDRVVPVASSLEYLQLIGGARHQVLERTGHLGLLLRPDEFAAMVTEFLACPCESPVLPECSKR
jgi:2-hydroxymuconate-semialdehyde hydrolase/2-hydroxy-6-oxo-octa-2,4-dienoate hydrolase